MQVILSQLVLLISWLSVADIEARSTQVSAQYTVGDGNGDVVSNKRFIGRGIVEDEVLEDVGGYRNYKNRPARVRITRDLIKESGVLIYLFNL